MYFLRHWITIVKKSIVYFNVVQLSLEIILSAIYNAKLVILANYSFYRLLNFPTKIIAILPEI